MSSNRSLSTERRLRNLRQITRRSSREDVLNVFTPNSVVTAPAKFAGRRRQLEQMIDALLTQGADLIVFGERGCGKSSLANMLYRIATGNLELLDYYGLREYLERKGFLSWLFGSGKRRFNVIWVDGFGKDLDGVIRSVLTRRREDIYGPGLMAYLSREADQVEVSAKIGFDKVFVGENGFKSIYTPDKPINVKEGFEIAMQRYADQQQDELIIIIDEFETVTNRSDISQFLKSVKRARFVLVGIAATTLELIGQHASVARDTHAVELKSMETDELLEILDIGEFILEQCCGFSSYAKKVIAERSYGAPYWCHFITKAIIQNKLDRTSSFEEFMLHSADENRIEPADVARLVAGLPQKPECGIWEAALRQLTMGDDTTKRVILEIARSRESIVSSAVVVDKLKNTEGIDKDTTLQTIAGILNMPNSPFEKQGQIRDIASFSFLDPNFKRYLLLRNAGL